MARTKNILKRIFKWLGALILVVVTILFVLQIILIVHFDKIIADTLKETVVESTDDLYSVDFEKLSINVFTGSLYAKKIYLKPDTLLYKKLKEMKTAPTTLFSIYIPELSISRVDLLSSYFSKKLSINSISIESPEVTLLNEPGNRSRKEKRRKNPLDLYPLISSVFKKAGCKRIEINNAGFIFERVNNDKIIKQVLPNLSLTFEQVIIDSTAFTDTTNLFYSDNINLSLDNYIVKLPDSLYNLKFGNIFLSTKQSYVRATNIKFTPRHKKYEFARVKGSQIDRIQLAIRKVEFKKIDLRRFFEDQDLIIDEIVINKLDLNAFRDKRLPFDFTKHPKMPQDVLKAFPHYINIKKIRLRDMNVTYEEMPVKGGETGTVFFNNIFARITDINNDSASIQKGQIIWIKAQGYLMGKGLINAIFKFPLNSSNGTYSYNGTLENMKLTAMNPVLRPLASVEIKDGLAKKMEFSVTANNDKAYGTMKFYYNDLKIKLINKESGESGFKEKLGSFIANNFIVISDNPYKEEFRTGKMYFVRDKNKFLFNYWWKTILSGVKPSLGFDEKKQSTLDDLKNKLKDRKVKHQQKKQERIERRLEKKANKESKSEETPK